jgi:cytoskeleton protein RodZ
VNKPAKLPEIRKEAFTKARESLGLSIKELSAKSCFSVHQIEQLENGETSSFYGPQVKVTAAKKVASLLNLSEEEAFDFSGVQPPTKPAPEPIQSQAVSSSKSSPSSTPEIPQEKPVTKKTVAAPKLRSKDSDNKPKRKLFLILVVIAVLVFSVINLRPLFFPEPPKEEVVIVEEVVQEPAPANPPIEEAKTASTQASAPVEAVAPAAVISAECPAADTAITYKPDAPKKAGDVVYLQSKTAQTVCVIDASGKTQNKTLEPGVGVSVYGKPPFKVLTGGLNQVDLYFQGAKVRTSGAGSTGKTIILEAADIPQPATSTDSQMR